MFNFAERNHSIVCRMNHPFVSVIIPNYNHASFLDERISSILNQNYDAFELIILDDKSTDNSQNVINKYKDDSHVSHIIYNDENSGSPFIQWQKGFELAKGELIWIAESDDYCESNLLRILVTQFEKNSNCSLAFCRTVKVDVNGHKLSEEGLSANMSLDGKTFVRDYMSRYNYIVNASSALFDKKAITGIDNAYTTFRGCGDWVFWIEIAMCGDVAYVDAPLNYFRQHGTNTTAQQTRTGKGEYEIIKVARYLRGKQYIGKKEFFRIQVVHVSSLKFGKMKSFFPDDIKKDIVKAWHVGFMGNAVVVVLQILHSLGFNIIKR